MGNEVGRQKFSRQERDAELKRLLDSCPDEVLMLLLELVRAKEQKALLRTDPVVSKLPAFCEPD
jgi:hypothetical protein